MPRCLVSLVSDQTIPNILVAAHFRPDVLLFLSTPAMEQRGKTRAILQTLSLLGLDYQDHSCCLKVQEDDIHDLQDKVRRWLDTLPERYQFLVNLTGGTKLMSIAAYELFKNHAVRMVYVPLSRNEFLLIHPPSRSGPVPLATRLTVMQYLTAYGVQVTNASSLQAQHQEAEARQDLTRFVFSHYRELQPLLNELNEKIPRVNRKKAQRGVELRLSFVPDNAAQEKLLSDLGFVRDGGEISKSLSLSDWHYLRGGWLEERLWLALKAVLPGADVQLGVQFLDPEGNRNELDVLFTRDNVLYLVECKSLGGGKGASRATKTVNAFLYKLGTLRQQFGLTPKGLLATNDPKIMAHGSIKPVVEKRARQANTRILPLESTPDLEESLRHLLLGSS